MFSFNFIKFFGIFAFALVTFTACRSCQNATGGQPSPTPFTAEEIVSEIPFSTKDPEIFQAEIVITTAGDSEDLVFVARNGARRRFDLKAGASQISVIETDKNYLLVRSRKVYAENAPQTMTPGYEWTDLLTTEWLNARHDAKFSRLETENNLTKYRVAFGDADAARSESIIFIDETSKMPVRQEFYSLENGQRILRMTVELRNVKLEAADELFAVPKEFKKVSADELRAILKQRNE